MEKIKTGLIMEGGAMRGLFTAGVIDVMMENNITYDGAIGVSAGAAFGYNYKSNQPGRVIRYNMANCKNPKFCSIRSLIKTGNIYGADYCYREIPDELDLFDNKYFAENPMEFYSVSTDIETGKAVYTKIDSITPENMDWLRASASLPLVSRIVEVGGKKLLDGGIADSVPLRYFESIGYNRNVIILTQPAGYVKGKNKTMPLIKLSLHKYPNMIRAVQDRHIMYNDTIKYIAEREKAGDILVIRPEEKLPIGRIEHDAANMKRVYDMGRAVGEKFMPAIKDFLKVAQI